MRERARTQKNPKPRAGPTQLHYDVKTISVRERQSERERERERWCME